MYTQPGQGLVTVHRREHVLEVQQQPQLEARHGHRGFEGRLDPLVVLEPPVQCRNALKRRVVGAVLVAVEHDDDPIEAPGMDAQRALALCEQTLGVLDDPERLGSVGCR